MITTFRLVKKKQASDGFSGEGSKRFGGRWNHKGRAVVYLSDTLSLAALELFIHLGREGLHIPFQYFKVEIPDHVSVSFVEAEALPDRWREEPLANSTKDLGTQWVDAENSPLLRVPSAVVPIENNYLLNIQRPQAKDITIHNPKPFAYDPRMWKK